MWRFSIPFKFSELYNSVERNREDSASLGSKDNTTVKRFWYQPEVWWFNMWIRIFMWGENQLSLMEFKCFFEWLLKQGWYMGFNQRSYRRKFAAYKCYSGWSWFGFKCEEHLMCVVWFYIIKWRSFCVGYWTLNLKGIFAAWEY